MKVSIERLVVWDFRLVIFINSVSFVSPFHPQSQPHSAVFHFATNAKKRKVPPFNLPNHDPSNHTNTTQTRQSTINDQRSTNDQLGRRRRKHRKVNFKLPSFFYYQLQYIQKLLYPPFFLYVFTMIHRRKQSSPIQPNHSDKRSPSHKLDR